MDQGAVICDAGLLAGGGVVIALGSGGMWRIAGDGTPLRIDVIAERVVVADDGRHAIALHQLTSANGLTDWALAEVDLATGRVLSRCELKRLEGFPSTYAQRMWFVVTQAPSLLVALKLQDDGPPQQAHSAEDPGWFDSMRRRGSVLHVETSSLGACHYIQYTLPELRFVAMGDMPHCSGYNPNEYIGGHMIPPICSEPVTLLAGVDSSGARFALEEGAVSIPLHLHLGRGRLRFDAWGGWAAALLAYDGGACAVPLDIPRRRLLPRLWLPGNQEGGVRTEGGQLLAWETAGRVVLVDLAQVRALLSLAVDRDRVRAVPVRME